MSVKIKGVSSVQIKLARRPARKYKSGLHAMAGAENKPHELDDKGTCKHCKQGPKRLYGAYCKKRA